MLTTTSTTPLRFTLPAVLAFAIVMTAVLTGALPTAAAAVSADKLPPPEEPGPYNVGETTFTAVLTGGRLTQIQVFYPTSEPIDCNSVYTINTPVGPYELQSPLCAVADAQALPGLFPLVVHDHGGGGPGQDFQLVAQLPLHETMASHGFVMAVALHAGNPVTRVLDLSLVIDTMLACSADPSDLLFNCIDPARIGISGESAGGSAAIGVAGGRAANGISADPRIKAMAVYEPGPFHSLDDASAIAIPYLVMGGTQHRNGLAVPALFDATVLAIPRIYVLNQNATHFNYITGMGAEIDQTREAALLADPTIPEPLTVRSTTNAPANRAYELWNYGEILFPLVGFGAGSGRNFCTRVGVNSVRSLDANGDGFTDSPPFTATDAFTLQPPIPEDVMVPVITLYSVSFWKTFLEGDHRYARYLAPGYAKRNQLAAEVFKVE